VVSLACLAGIPYQLQALNADTTGFMFEMGGERLWRVMVLQAARSGFPRGGLEAFQTVKTLGYSAEDRQHEGYVKFNERRPGIGLRAKLLCPMQ
jgi:hypothetical protein